MRDFHSKNSIPKDFTGVGMLYGKFKVHVVNGLIHREDGPACYSLEVSEWLQHGKQHRIDGPCVVIENDPLRNEYAINGIKLTEQQFYSHPDVIEHKLKNIFTPKNKTEVKVIGAYNAPEFEGSASITVLVDQNGNHLERYGGNFDDKHISLGTLLEKVGVESQCESYDMGEFANEKVTEEEASFLEANPELDGKDFFDREGLHYNLGKLQEFRLKYKQKFPQLYKLKITVEAEPLSVEETNAVWEKHQELYYQEEKKLRKEENERII